MNRTVVATSVFIALVVAAILAPANAKVIRNDEGGFVVDYAVEANKLQKTGEKVIIDGDCMSACTLFLSLKNTCVTPRSRLVFHSAWGGPANMLRAMNKLVLATYPPKVRAWIKRKGGLTSKLLILQGKELVGKVRMCE